MLRPHLQGLAEAVPHRGLLALLALALFFAHPVHAENTTTTAYNVTITVPVVTVTVGEAWTVTYHFENDTLVIQLSCSGLGECPEIHLVVGWNGTVYLNKTYTVSGRGSAGVRVEVEVPSDAAWIYYEYDGVERNETVYKQRVTGSTALAVMLVTIGLALGVAVRTNPRVAAAGLLATSLFPWLLAAHGYAPPEAMVLSLVMVIGGAALLVAAGGR